MYQKYLLTLNYPKYQQFQKFQQHLLIQKNQMYL
jgi:hypothetical protein